MNQPLYIRSTACITPRQSGEPDYRTLLDPKHIRRMSRIIRMGAAAALSCLREAGAALPDAIVTGTAYGCLEDTGLFLNSMIERKEEMLQPATFIQSTHNTVGAQIALLLQCTGYNNTIVHRGSSFETALLDAAMLLADGEAVSVLVGGVDEITATSHALLSRFGLYRRGAVAGEGAAFFLLTGRPSGHDLARIDAVDSFYRPESARAVEERLLSLLHTRGLGPADIDLLITGDNGDETSDRIYRQVADSLFPGRPVRAYKKDCGEYPTSASFGLSIAAQQVRSGAGRVLLYNHYLGIHHAAYLLSSADNPLSHAAQ